MHISTNRFGSLIAIFGAAAAGRAEAPVTFAKDVAPILQRACQSCHRPGSIGPMPLLTYQETRPWARSIKEQVTQRNMPPWFEDRSVGIQKFKNDPSLSDREIATISKWVEAGAPMGNPADMPPPREFEGSDRWHIGKPDVVVTLKKDVLVKARQADQWLDLPLESMNSTTDRYIQAVEIKPVKGVKVLHHAVSTMRAPNEDGVQGESHLEEYAVGKSGDIFPEGTGMLMKAGTQIMVNVHLHADGEDTPMNLAVGLKLYPEGEVPKHVEISQHVGDDTELDIPPNTKNVRADGYTVLLKPARITAFQPHMHNRGQAQCLELIYPHSTLERAGKASRETVSCVDRWKFDWHIVYHYEDDVQPIVPAGTIVHIISLFDNTSGNHYNPDPSNPVGFGQRTIDDMAFAWLSFYYLSDEEYRQAVAGRAAQAALAPASTAGHLPPDVGIHYASGQGVQPFFEGWQRNLDGTVSMWFGYLNRNFKEEVDVAVGPGNGFEPGGDRGQPTHFYPRRQQFVFKVDLPKDWDKDQKLVWTVTAHGSTSRAVGWMQPEWEVDEGVRQMNVSLGATPPVDPPNVAPSITGSPDQTVEFGKAVKLTASAKDDGLPKPRGSHGAGLRLRWVLYRGPGDVTLERESTRREPGSAVELTTEASFSAPGIYWLRAIASDGMLESNHDVRVTVTPH